MSDSYLTEPTQVPQKGENVLQDWVADCSFKEQTVMLCALRGPDAAGSKEIKAWVRWIRATVLRNADNKERFMRTEERIPFSKLVKENTSLLDMLPSHYMNHLMHGLQVIGLRHPDGETRMEAWWAYCQICDWHHLQPEGAYQMAERLKDNR